MTAGAQIWRLTPDGRLSPWAWPTASLGPAPRGPLVIAPGDLVLLRVVHLPVSGHARRAAALGFALEEDLAAPLEALHIQLGPQLAPRHHLAAVVSKAQLARWQAAARGLPRAARLVPEPLLLPLPTAPVPWLVWVEPDAPPPGRAVVRQQDGAGFACPLPMLSLIWHRAGSPPVAHLGPLAPPLPSQPQAPRAARRNDPAASLGLPLAVITGPAVDPVRPVVRSAAVLTLGLLAALGLRALETGQLEQAAATQRQALLAALRQRGADPAPGQPLVPLVEDLVAPHTPRAFGPLLPALSAVLAPLQPLQPELAVTALGFDRAAARLALDLAAPQLATLQAAEAALRQVPDLALTQSPEFRAGASGAETRLVLSLPAEAGQ